MKVAYQEPNRLKWGPLSLNEVGRIAEDIPALHLVLNLKYQVLNCLLVLLTAIIIKICNYYNFTINILLIEIFLHVELLRSSFLVNQIRKEVLLYHLDIPNV